MIEPEHGVNLLMKQVDGLLNYLIAALFMAGATYFFWDIKVRRIAWFPASVSFGCLFGWIALELTGSYGLGLIVAALATGTAPMSLAAISKQNLPDVMEDWIEAFRKVRNNNRPPKDDP